MARHHVASVTPSTRASGEMADALASGASVRKDVGVQVPPRAPTLRAESEEVFTGGSFGVVEG